MNKTKARTGQRDRIAKCIKDIRSLGNIDRDKRKDVIDSLLFISINYPKV